MKTVLEAAKAEAIRRGYRFEVSEDGQEERMIRPDGTVAVIARRKPDAAVKARRVNGSLKDPNA